MALKFCPNCGKKNVNNSNFCPDCGTKLNVEEAKRASKFIIHDGVLEKYEGEDAIVRVPDSVTIIGRNAFGGNLHLQEVILPSRLKRIEGSVFSYCYKLRSIRLPSSLEYIGKYAFAYCQDLEEIVIPGSVRVIDDEAFGQCAGLGLKKVVLSEGLVQIGREAFEKCLSLRSISLPRSLKQIGRWAFRDTNLKDIYYPGTKEEFKRITIDGSYGVPKLKDIFLPGDYATAHCSDGSFGT